MDVAKNAVAFILESVQSICFSYIPTLLLCILHYVLHILHYNTMNNKKNQYKMSGNVLTVFLAHENRA